MKSICGVDNILFIINDEELRSENEPVSSLISSEKDSDLIKKSSSNKNIQKYEKKLKKFQKKQKK